MRCLRFSESATEVGFSRAPIYRLQQRLCRTCNVSSSTVANASDSSFLRMMADASQQIGASVATSPPTPAGRYNPPLMLHDISQYRNCSQASKPYVQQQATCLVRNARITIGSWRNSSVSQSRFKCTRFMYIRFYCSRIAYERARDAPQHGTQGSRAERVKKPVHAPFVTCVGRIGDNDVHVEFRSHCRAIFMRAL